MEAFGAWRADPSRCLPAAMDIARSHGLPDADPHLFSTGTNLVVALNDRLILKLFPPMLRGQYLSERISLSQLLGHLSVPIPEIVLDGERDNGVRLRRRQLPAELAIAAEKFVGLFFGRGVGPSSHSGSVAGGAGKYDRHKSNQSF